jgi:hypothetical protein
MIRADQHVVIVIFLLYWRHQKAKEAAKRAKTMATAANALGCTPDEVEALVLLHKLRSDNRHP